MAGLKYQFSSEMREFLRELQISMRVVWLIVSAAILSILLLPFAGAAGVAKITPVCQSKARLGRPCAFCGMTTGFLAISEGRFGDAGRANRGSIPLYGTFVLNEICVAGVLAKGAFRCKSLV